MPARNGSSKHSTTSGCPQYRIHSCVRRHLDPMVFTDTWQLTMFKGTWNLRCTCESRAVQSQTSTIWYLVLVSRNAKSSQVLRHFTLPRPGLKGDLSEEPRSKVALSKDKKANGTLSPTGLQRECWCNRRIQQMLTHPKTLQPTYTCTKLQVSNATTLMLPMPQQKHKGFGALETNILTKGAVKSVEWYPELKREGSWLSNTSRLTGSDH